MTGRDMTVSYLMNSAHHLIEMSEQDYLRLKQRVNGEMKPTRQQRLKGLGTALCGVKQVPIKK
jgi:hypothetical protein